MFEEFVNFGSLEDVQRRFVMFFVSLIVLGMIVENIYPVVKRKKFYSLKKHFWVDVFHFALTGFVTGALASIGTLGLIFIVDNAPGMGAITEWVGSQPLWWQIPTGFLMIMFFDYWDHRLAHEWRWRWRLHGVHHSSEELDWIAGIRLHPIDQAIHRTIVYGFTFMWGFQLEVFLAVFGVMVFQAVFVHMNVKVSFGFLNRIFVSPQVHHWHHAEDPINTNYGAFSPIMDQIFGTYYCPKGEWPKSYGIKAPLPENWLVHMIAPFGYKRIWRDYYDQEDQKIAEGDAEAKPQTVPAE